jgi:hypothetical protein
MPELQSGKHIEFEILLIWGRLPVPKEDSTVAAAKNTP